MRQPESHVPRSVGSDESGDRAGLRQSFSFRLDDGQVSTLAAANYVTLLLDMVCY